jgi:hypothetical protein
MRPLSLVGVVLLVLGAFVLLRGVDFTSKREVLKVGDLKATVDERRTVPTWVGALALVAGLGLVVAGVSKRR